LEKKEKSTSFFEFFPTKLMYTPVAIKWLYLSVRHMSLTLPLIANPKLTLAGMVGVRKSELLKQATGACEESILAWENFIVSKQDADKQALIWLESINSFGLNFPFVCKPDIGCRGSGVKLIKNINELKQVIDSYPENTSLMIQKLADWKDEVGIFYVKMPGKMKGQIVSLTFKHSPKVIGDGIHTLKELLQKDNRAKDLLHLYENRNHKTWNKILAQGRTHYLLFSASHCQGAVFEDARKHITIELTNVIDSIMQGLPEFYYGRLDVKYKNLEELKNGKNLQIIEINGASAESIHIWDRNTSFLDAIKTLLWQYTTLFKLGSYNRKKGYKPPGLLKFYKHWKIEKNLAKYYPDTD